MQIGSSLMRSHAAPVQPPVLPAQLAVCANVRLSWSLSGGASAAAARAEAGCSGQVRPGLFACSHGHSQPCFVHAVGRCSVVRSELHRLRRKWQAAWES